MDTFDLIGSSLDDEFDKAFKQELAEQYEGELINLVLDIVCAVENLENIYPDAARLVRKLAIFVENIELRIRGDLE